MFYRLLVVADDFGYMDARPAILKAQCFPLKESATLAKIETWLRELAASRLIGRYTQNGKPYLSIGKWEQRQRSRPKYAGPEDDGCQPIDGQLSDNCQTIDGLGKGRGKGRGAAAGHAGGLRSIPEDWQPSIETSENLAREFSLAPEDIARYVGAFRDACKAKGYRYADFNAAFRNCVRDDWPKFRQRGLVALAGGKLAI